MARSTIRRLTPLLLGIALSVRLATDAAAVPAAPGTFTLRQPDGRTVAARVTGDEWENAIETLDGYTLLEDPTSAAWVYAVRDIAGRLVPSDVVAGEAPPSWLSRRMRSATAPLQRWPEYAPATGHVMTPLGQHKLLVIVADFTPSISHLVTEKEFARHFFLGAGEDDPTSVANYWDAVSYGQLKIVP